jgi:hypothetical protein
MRLALCQCYFEADSADATIGQRCIETVRVERLYEASLNRGCAVLPRLIIGGSVPTLFLLLFIKTANGLLTRWQLYYSKTQQAMTHHRNNTPAQTRHSTQNYTSNKGHKIQCKPLQIHN